MKPIWGSNGKKLEIYQFKREGIARNVADIVTSTHFWAADGKGGGWASGVHQRLS